MPADSKKVAFASVVIAFAVLMLFLYCAQYVLDEMRVGVPAFRIAGGTVLCVFARQMILRGHHQGGPSEAPRTVLEIAVFPVAMPAMAGPGALLAVVLLTDNSHFSFLQQSLTAAIAVAVLGVVLAAMLLAARVQRYLGSAGITIMTQIIGLVLAAFAVQQILDGLGAGLGHG